MDADYDPVADAQVEDGEYIECSVCGADMEWVDCYHCHGEGEFDLYDQNPNEYEPGEVERCDVCYGAGGYLECPNVPHDKSA